MFHVEKTIYYSMVANLLFRSYKIFWAIKSLNVLKHLLDDKIEVVSVVIFMVISVEASLSLIVVPK